MLGPVLFAIMLFLAIMTMTWETAEGIGNPSRQQDTIKPLERIAETTDDAYAPPAEDLPDPPTSVPEPGTLILLGSGLTAGYLYLRRKMK